MIMNSSVQLKTSYTKRMAESGRAGAPAGLKDLAQISK